MTLEVFQDLKIPKTQPTGVYKFKKGFNGDFVEFVDELYMVFDPFINTNGQLYYSDSKTTGTRPAIWVKLNDKVVDEYAPIVKVKKVLYNGFRW